MSSGIVVCSVCRREVHQDGPIDATGVASWRHCEDKTPMATCGETSVAYPGSKNMIVGPYCGRDESPEDRREGMTRAERRRDQRATLKGMKFR